MVPEGTAEGCRRGLRKHRVELCILEVREEDWIKLKVPVPCKVRAPGLLKSSSFKKKPRDVLLRGCPYAKHSLTELSGQRNRLWSRGGKGTSREGQGRLSQG